MIVVYGTVCVDKVRRIERLPRRGEYAEIESEALHLGGEAANTSIALATWGAQVSLFGNPLGTDDLGTFVRRGLSERQVDPGHLPGIDDPTAFCEIYVTHDGERTMFGLGFRRLEDLTLADFTLVPGAWFTTDPNHGAIAREAVRRALASGMRVYLEDFFRPDDPITAESFWQSSTDWVGSRGNTQKNVAWLRDWVAQYGCFAVLSDGPNGFVAGSLQSPIRHYPPYPCPALIDSTGAGDAFRAGMLFGLDQSWKMEDCLRFASAAGCLNCRSYGGNAGLPSVEEIQGLIHAHPEISRQYV